MFFDQAGKRPPPTVVRLKGPFTSFSHDDVVAAVELFGKTNFVRLLESKQEVFKPMGGGGAGGGGGAAAGGGGAFVFL